MRILFAASEAYPLAKTGGLADVVGSLPKALAARGHEVSVVLPRYRAVSLDKGPAPAESLGPLEVPMGEGKVERAKLYKTYLDERRQVPAFLVDHEAYFGSRRDLYGFPDDPWRFAFYSRSIIEVIRRLRLQPDVVHSHDWHTGLVPAYLKHLRETDPDLRAASVFTIHNLRYQGMFGRDIYGATGLPWSYFNPDGLEYYGGCNSLKAGIVYADRVNTVSPTYAKEIQTPEQGHGLEGLLRHCAWKLSGIVNGIDNDVWDPARDPHLPVQYGPGKLDAKREMKRALQREVGLNPDGRAVFSFVGRLVDQKGMDIVMPILPRLIKNAQLVILGTGDPSYHSKLAALDARGSLSILLKYDEELAHRIYSGSDIFLMPSLYEPCGLGQLIALRYGTTPIVRRTGGLADTVVDADLEPDTGTGFAFDEYTSEQLDRTVTRALAAYSNPSRWSRLINQGMAQDFSWTASTKLYEELYRSAAAAVA